MLISRTPLRISLGGGGTDLPSYCSRYGGFIFGCAIKMYVDIFIRRPWVGVSKKIELQYLKFESVDLVTEVQHTIGREALRLTGVDRSINIYFKSDAPAGTGLGSSGSCAVGLLGGLWKFQGMDKDQEELAEEAFEVTQRLNLPDGKQDPYLGALGGFTVLEIAADQTVKWYHPVISPEISQRFLDNSVFFYSGVIRDSIDVLHDQNNPKALELKHKTKTIGRQILSAFQNGSLNDFGRLMHEHWIVKREMSGRISSSAFDHIYEIALTGGALGGKLIGAGGGGYFMFYCPDGDAKIRLLEAMRKLGFKNVPLGVDYKGTRAVEVEV